MLVDVFAVDMPEEAEESIYHKIMVLMKNKDYDDLVDLCTQEIEKGNQGFMMKCQCSSECVLY